VVEVQFIIRETELTVLLQAAEGQRALAEEMEPIMRQTECFQKQWLMLALQKDLEVLAVLVLVELPRQQALVETAVYMEAQEVEGAALEMDLIAERVAMELMV
jgi:hypothetical protein